MIIQKKTNETGGHDPDISEEDRKKYSTISYNTELDSYEAELPPEEKLRQEFDQKLEQRVNQIAEAVASGARGQELADKMRKK